jgi:hypothetical protein
METKDLRLILQKAPGNHPDEAAPPPARRYRLQPSIIITIRVSEVAGEGKSVSQIQQIVRPDGKHTS